MALLMFYGTECKHCHEMFPSVDKLKEETGLELEKVETWHNAKNAKRLQELDQGQCGGVPFFYNEKTNEAICGSTTYDKLKEWATKGQAEMKKAA